MVMMRGGWRGGGGSSGDGVKIKHKSEMLYLAEQARTNGSGGVDLSKVFSLFLYSSSSRPSSIDSRME